MQSKLSNLICGAAISALVILYVPLSDAATYSFTQSGFDYGGVITGSFDGVDYDQNGQISTQNGEVSNFSLSYTSDPNLGNVPYLYVQNFSLSQNSLFRLTYNLDSGLFGNDPPDGSGITAINNISSEQLTYDYVRISNSYEVRPGVISNAGLIGRVTGPGFSGVSPYPSAHSDTPISVSVAATPNPATVPIPAAVWLFGSSLLAMLGGLKKRRGS